MKTIKKLFCGLVLSLLLTVVLSGAYKESFAKEKKADLEKVNVKWTLKKGKKLSYYSMYPVIGNLKSTVTMTKYKVSKTADGKKQIKFTVVYSDLCPNPTKDQIIELNNQFGGDENFAGRFYYAVVDYKTGMSLEAENDLGVVVTEDSIKYYDTKYFDADNDVNWVGYDNKVKISVTITYPEDYKDMVILVGGMKSYSVTDDELDFFNGLKKFSEASFYGKKKACYGLRVG